MIALCREHHEFADAQRYTKSQLQEFKKSPYIKSGKVSEEYGYLRRNTVYCAGDCIGYGVDYVLMIDEEPVIWFERDEEGYDRLNLLIKDSQGNTILYMKNNDWIVFTESVFDIVCPAKGQTLRVTSKDKKTNFELRFDDLSVEYFKARLLKLKHTEPSIDRLLSEIEPEIPGRISTWTIKGFLTYRNIELHIDDSGIKNAVNEVSFSGCVIIRSEVFLNLDETGGFFMGGPRPKRTTKKMLEKEIRELEKADSIDMIYRRAGQVYFMADRDQLIEDLKDKVKTL